MKLLVTSLLIAFAITTFSQPIQQTVRGTIVDKDSQMPLIGAAVYVVGSNPAIGAVTDIDGNFRLLNVPVGRVTLKVTFMGYEEQTIPNLLVSSAKEEIVNVTMVESLHTLQEITVTATEQKGEVL